MQTYRKVANMRKKSPKLTKVHCLQLYIPNGCFEAYEVKVNKDIFKYPEKVKLISQFQRFLTNFNGFLEFASFP